MPVRFLYPAAVKAVHQKAAVGHIEAHAHDPAQRDIALAVIFYNAAAGYDVRGREHRVVKLKRDCSVALAHADNKCLRGVFIVIRRRQALHGNAAGNYLVAFIQKIRGKAAVRQFHLYRRLPVVSPADARPLKAEIIEAIAVIGGIVHYAAAYLDIVLNAQRFGIGGRDALAVMDMLKMPEFRNAEYVARTIGTERENALIVCNAHRITPYFDDKIISQMPRSYKSFSSPRGALRRREMSPRTSVIRNEVANTSPIGSTAARIIIFISPPPQIQSLQARRKKSH